MAKISFSDKIAALFSQENWEEARQLLAARIKREPSSHWLLTQLAVTFYEQREYAEAYQLLLKSYKLLGDCPLTLWNLAGTCEALGKTNNALQIFAWLVRSNKTAQDDECWESEAWTAALKADCIFRISGILEKVRPDKAREGYQQYLNQLASGVEGIYSFEDVRRRLATLPHSKSPPAFESVLDVAGLSKKRGSKQAPVLNLDLLETASLPIVH